MSNFEKLNIKPEPEIDRITTKTRFEYELAESGRTMIPGPLAAFEIYRTSYRDLAFTMYEECSDGDRIGGSQDEATLVHAVMRLAGIGAAGTAATALSMAGDIGKTVGKIGLKAGSIGVGVGCLALTGSGKVLGSLARAAMKQSISVLWLFHRLIRLPRGYPL